MVLILLILYVAAGYWATGLTIYRNRIIVRWVDRFLFGILLGWLLIPIAIIRVIFHI